MLRSMTGFGSVHGTVEGVDYAVEIRSVNNRYLKPVVKLPEAWAAAEPQIESLLRKRVYRGTVTLSVRMKIPDDQVAHRVNAAALASYIDQLKILEVETNPTLRIDLSGMLMLPGVCEPPPLEELRARTESGLMAMIDRAVDELIRMRDREGQGLRDEFVAHCKVVLDRLSRIMARAPMVLQEYHDRLASRVRELTNTAKLDIDEDLLAREVAVYADRCDVAEENSRLRSHVEHFQKAMDAPEPSGRRLDFIAQEMLREANTIGSKSNDAQIALAVVDIKTAIDRIKEQVQNVE